MKTWKQIKNYNYEASSDGDVRNIKTGRILKQRISETGYKYVDIQIDKKNVACRAHKLIAEAFYGAKDNKWQVDHINRIRSDNRVINLRWVNSIDNMKNRFFGDINEMIINEIIALHKENKSIGEIYNRINNKE